MLRSPTQRLPASRRPNSAKIALTLMLLAGMPGCATLPGGQTPHAAVCAATALNDFASHADPAPCGPASWPLALRRLVPQQFAGADFRPACRCHDRCYETGGADRTACDDRFRHNLVDACQSSRCPLLCRLVARGMHCSVACLGGWFYRSDRAIR